MKTTFLRIAVFSALAIILLTANAVALEVPQLSRYVTDKAGVLSSGDRDAIERLLSDYDRSTSQQFVVLIVSSLDGESLEDYSIRVVEKNLIGQKEKDNGLLFLVVVDDRKMRFEVGYGLEHVLTDALTSMIISDVVAPEFRTGNYAQGVYNGLQTAIKVTTGEYTVSSSERRPTKKKGSSIVNLIIFLVIMFFIIRGNKRGGRGGGMWFIGPFGGGGGFGGGSGGFGGGGFGGFSGGGGGFGGGGASGSW